LRSAIVYSPYETHTLAEVYKSAMLPQSDALKKFWDGIMKPET